MAQDAPLLLADGWLAGGEALVFLKNHPGRAQKVGPASAGHGGAVFAQAKLTSDLLDVNRRAKAGKPYPIVPVFVGGQLFVKLAGCNSDAPLMHEAKHRREVLDKN